MALMAEKNVLQLLLKHLQYLITVEVLRLLGLLSFYQMKPFTGKPILAALVRLIVVFPGLLPMGVLCI